MQSRRPTATLLAWSVIGLLGGHQAAYLLVYRDPAVTAHVLADAGHGWLWIAPFLLAAAAAIAIVVGIRGGDPVRSFRRRFSALAAIQMGTFILLEVSERATHGGTADLLSGIDAGGWLVLIVGLALQVATALVVTLASRVVELIGLATTRARRRGRVRVAGARRRRATPEVALQGLLSVRARGPRAPPLSA